MRRCALAWSGRRWAPGGLGAEDRALEAETEMMPVGADLTFTLTITNPGNAPAEETVIQRPPLMV